MLRRWEQLRQLDDQFGALLAGDQRKGVERHVERGFAKRPVVWSQNSGMDAEGCELLTRSQHLDARDLDLS